MTEFLFQDLQMWMVALSGIVLVLSGGILGYWASSQLRKK
jgi:hypothetical protein